MNGGFSTQRWILTAAIGVAALFAVTNGCALFEDERTAKGRELYGHYCMHCHGESGRQNEGFNWARMPDPRPKDLSAKAEMSTFSDEEIFHTIYRDMKDTTPEVGDKIGDEEFAVPTMPTFKYTLSEEEIWGIVAYVRTLHGVSLTYDVEGRRKELEATFQAAQQEFDQATQALEVAQQKADEAEEAAAAAEEDVDEDLDEDVEEEDEEYEEVVLPEEEALEKVTVVFEKAKKEFENFTKRPKRGSVARPDLTVSDEDRGKLVEVGKRLYRNKYGCNGCHSLNGGGGLVGPALDRAGFRLNDTWVYRWIQYPQGMKRKTRMPNLGISDQDAKAVTLYLETLRAPKPEKPIPPPE